MSAKFMTGAAVQPRQDMPEPYILWDSRSWDGSIGVGTGGIPNEGTAGSAFDLDVAERIVGDGYYAYFAKQGTQPENFEWVTTSTDWDAVGGVPCDGPITIMMAFGDFPRSRTAGVQTGFPNGAAYALQYFRYTSPSTRSHWEVGGEWFNNPDGDMNGYIEADANTDACDYKFSTAYSDSNPGDDLAVRERLLVLTHDVADGGGTFWRWPDPCPAEIQFVPPTVPTLTPFTFELFDEDAPCDGTDSFAPCAGAGSQGSILGGTNQQLNFIGEHRSYAPLIPGQPWNGLIGVAMFRGEPTRAQIQYWRDYFLSGYTAPVSPLRYTGGTIRVDATHVYHRYTLGTSGLAPIAGQPLPATVDVFLVGGGGRGGETSPSTTVGPRGGGAGGEAVEFLAQSAPASAVTVVVGAGGTGATQDGGDSIFDTTGVALTAQGGLRGQNIAGGGSGGDNASFTGGTASGNAGGGGAGAGGNGTNGVGGPPGFAGDGGPPVLNDWRTGTSEEYGEGGGGGGRAAFADPDIVCGDGYAFIFGANPNTGGGGRAQCETIGSASSGQPGIVIVRYLRAD